MVKDLESGLAQMKVDAQQVKKYEQAAQAAESKANSALSRISD